MVRICTRTAQAVMTHPQPPCNGERRVKTRPRAHYVDSKEKLEMLPHTENINYFSCFEINDVLHEIESVTASPSHEMIV